MPDHGLRRVGQAVPGAQPPITEFVVFVGQRQIGAKTSDGAEQAGVHCEVVGRQEFHGRGFVFCSRRTGGSSASARAIIQVLRAAVHRLSGYRFRLVSLQTRSQGAEPAALGEAIVIEKDQTVPSCPSRSVFLADPGPALSCRTRVTSSVRVNASMAETNRYVAPSSTTITSNCSRGKSTPSRARRHTAAWWRRLYVGMITEIDGIIASRSQAVKGVGPLSEGDDFRANSLK